MGHMNTPSKDDDITFFVTKMLDLGAAKFKERLEFMRDVFVPKNNEAFHRKRFQFLYLEDTISAEERMAKTLQMIKEFFI